MERKVKVAAVAAQIEEFTRRIAEFKNQIVEYQSTSDKYKSQVDHVANSREYDSLSKEIENLDLLIQIADKNIFETKEAIANKRMELEELKERLAVREDDLAAKKEEMETIVASPAAEAEKLVEQRNKVESKLDERTVCAYDHIRNSNLNHLAVVAVYNGDSCGGCFSTIAPQRLVDIASNKKMIVCEYCGRILMNPEQ